MFVELHQSIIICLHITILRWTCPIYGIQSNTVLQCTLIRSVVCLSLLLLNGIPDPSSVCPCCFSTVSHATVYSQLKGTVGMGGKERQVNNSLGMRITHGSIRERWAGLAPSRGFGRVCYYRRCCSISSTPQRYTLSSFASTKTKS